MAKAKEKQAEQGCSACGLFNKSDSDRTTAAGGHLTADKLL
jgi:hypothetical protein